jgi:hypothetical protein
MICIVGTKGSPIKGTLSRGKNIHVAMNYKCVGSNLCLGH